MGRTLISDRLWRLVLILVASLVFPSALVAQSAVIQPCEAPAPSKPLPGKPVSPPVKVNEKASQTVIDSSIADDPSVEKILSPFTEKVRPLSLVIGTLEGDLKKEAIGAGTLGNFVTDAIVAEAKRKTGKNVVLAILNAGGLRKNQIAAGELRTSDIFELLPFENNLMTLDMTGKQLLKLTQIGTRDAQAGARIQFRWNEQNRTETIGTKLVDQNGTEHEIDPNAIYTIVTIDYLYKLASGPYGILQEATNIDWLKVTVRDAVLDYVKSETAAGRPIRARADNRFVQIGPGPKTTENPPND